MQGVTSSALVEAVQWVEGLMLGSVASVAAVVAIATLGLLMLGGRVEWRRAAMTILGCFVIFGAPAISAGLLTSVNFEGPNFSASYQETAKQPIISFQPPQPERYDPYAGAALPADW